MKVASSLSQTINLYLVGGGGGGNSYMVSVTPVCIIFYGHALSSKNETYRSCEWCKMSNKLSFLSICRPNVNIACYKEE